MLNLGVIIVIVAIGLFTGQTEAQCQECQENKVYCETETEYFVCLGDRKLGPYYCDPDHVCTNSDNGCEKKTDIVGDIKNVCGEDNGSCQTCKTGQKFTCVSRTQAALCAKGEVSPSAIMDCNEDQTCISDAEYEDVCVPNCVANFTKQKATCNNAVYIPPTLSPPTTPSHDEMQDICKEAAVNKPSKRFFFAYADSTCRSYVYCERNSISSTVFETTFTSSCSSPKIYFNTDSGACQAIKPDSCRTDSSRIERTTGGTTVMTTERTTEITPPGTTEHTSERTTEKTTEETTEFTTEETTENTEANP